jgi:hypothetical protein
MEMDRPVDEVQAVISFYYKTIRQKVTSLEGVNIHLENLGHFYIKERALDAEIVKCNTVIEMLSNNLIKEYSFKVDYQKKVTLMTAVKEMLIEEKLRRKLVINKRYNNETGS